MLAKFSHAQLQLDESLKKLENLIDNIHKNHQEAEQSIDSQLTDTQYALDQLTKKNTARQR